MLEKAAPEIVESGWTRQRLAARVAVFRAKYRFSPRESEVLVLICSGHHPKAVSEALGCGYASVRTYLRRMYRKVGCSGVRELMTRFFCES